jgi:hypothetical protein
MICPHCNEKYSDNLLVCPYCGKRKTSAPVAEPNPKTKSKLPPDIKSYDMPPMKWYNWEVWFVFFILPIFTLASIPFTLFGIIGQSLTPVEIAYYAFTLSASLVFSILQIRTRFKLKNYKKSAINWVLGMYISDTVISLVTVIFSASASGIVKNVALYVVFTYWLDLILDIIKVILIRTYYKKRKALFVN